MRFLRQSLTGVLFAALAAGLLIYALQIVLSAVEIRMANEGRAPPARERVFAVNVVPAVEENIAPTLEAFGEIRSRRTLELRATTAGRVVWLDERFVEGGTVTAGDVLARIDPANTQAALDHAESGMLDAKAEVRDAERSLTLARDELAAAEDQADLRERAFKRQTDLQARGVGTAATVETAELAAASARQAVLARRISVAQAEARVDQAKTRLERQKITLAEAQRGLDDTIITAGFSGTLSEVSLVEGRLVTQNEKMAKIIDPHALEVAFRISTAQYVWLLDAQGGVVRAPVEVMLDVSGVDLRARGQVSRDSIVTGVGQSGRRLFAHLDNAPGFKPGDFVTVHVEEPELENVVRLPSSTLDAANTVLVLEDGDRLASLPVTLLRRQRDDVLLRGEGLAGREVIVGRTPLLGVGIKVRPLKPRAEGQEVDQSASASSPVTGSRSTDDSAEMVELTDEQRDRMRAFVQANAMMPKEAKDRVLSLLDQPRVPAQLVQRIESRMGG